ncbi:hypothetical protein L6452_21058 [Arctium lappa]|uniref:Uncharacterized protein n=1 Tax=Arctium lappa TaxID=4217 RepID=A0ACB9BDL7_ARCLA|nr:hypothetical protein L6452_21058 [Arctium lappa]
MPDDYDESQSHCHNRMGCTVSWYIPATMTSDIAPQRVQVAVKCDKTPASGFGGFGLEDSSFVKEAQSGEKSRFSLNLARWNSTEYGQRHNRSEDCDVDGGMGIRSEICEAREKEEKEKGSVEGSIISGKSRYESSLML